MDGFYIHRILHFPETEKSYAFSCSCASPDYFSESCVSLDFFRVLPTSYV